RSAEAKLSMIRRSISRAIPSRRAAASSSVMLLASRRHLSTWSRRAATFIASQLLRVGTHGHRRSGQSMAEYRHAATLYVVQWKNCTSTDPRGRTTIAQEPRPAGGSGTAGDRAEGDED